MIGKVLAGAAGAVISVGLAAPAGAVPQDFLAAVRAAGITGTDPAMLADGYDVCSTLWNPGNASETDEIATVSKVTPDQGALGSRVAAGFVRDHPQLTTDQAAHFVLAAYDDLCPVPGSYDYWAYSTS
jgi:Protein of unknown function (DUF732)